MSAKAAAKNAVKKAGEDVELEDVKANDSKEDVKPAKKAAKKETTSEDGGSISKIAHKGEPAKKPSTTTNATSTSVVKTSSLAVIMSKKNHRNNMSHPKGAYILCMQDVGTEKADHLWRVSNHQLLQYYSRIDANDKTRYQRTNRYTNWFCSEGYKYMAVKVDQKINKEEEVVIVWPAQDKLDDFKANYDAENKPINEKMEAKEDE